MIRRFYQALPGPAVLRIVEMLVVVALAVLLLGALYEWVGSTFLDSGGAVG